MTADILAKFAGVEDVVSDTVRFKLRLGIGEDAYTSLKQMKNLSKLWEAGGMAATGAGAAASPLVAATFFPAKGFLAVLGLGTAATPIGWVVAAGIASGGAALAFTTMSEKYWSSRVDTIPRFINTPLDLLGAALFDLIGRLAVELAMADGQIAAEEAEHIKSEFVAQWGLNPVYVAPAFDALVETAGGSSLEEIARATTDFKRMNPDCNDKKMRVTIFRFLEELIAADGRIDAREEEELDRLKKYFVPNGKLEQLRNLSKEAVSRTVRLGNELKGRVKLLRKN